MTQSWATLDYYCAMLASGLIFALLRFEEIYSKTINLAHGDAPCINSSSSKVVPITSLRNRGRKAQFLFPIIRARRSMLPGHERIVVLLSMNSSSLSNVPENFHVTNRTFLLLTWWWWWLVWCVLCVWAASVCFCLECDWWCCDECWWWCGWLSRLIWWWDAFPEPWPTWMLCGRVELWGAECPWWPGWWPLCDSIRLKPRKEKVIAKDSKANVNKISLWGTLKQGVFCSGRILLSQRVCSQGFNRGNVMQTALVDKTNYLVNTFLQEIRLPVELTTKSAFHPDYIPFKAFHSKALRFLFQDKI